MNMKDCPKSEPQCGEKPLCCTPYFASSLTDYFYIEMVRRVESR
jgi:hypothetical protein